VPGRAGTAGRDSGPSTARFLYRAGPDTIKRALLRVGPLGTANLAIYNSVYVGTLAWRTIDNDTSHAESQRHCQNSSLFFPPRFSYGRLKLGERINITEQSKPGCWAAASYMAVDLVSAYFWLEQIIA
jgi:hypothetical protein